MCSSGIKNGWIDGRFSGVLTIVAARDLARWYSLLSIKFIDIFSTFCLFIFLFFVTGICICGDDILQLQFGDGVQEVEDLT